MSREYLPWDDSRRSDSIFSDEDNNILEAVERAKSFKLCLRRIWAFLSSVAGGEHSLPSLIPAADVFSVPSQKRQHHEHEQCTFDFCEHSRVDFTSVEQHHEHCEDHENCVKSQFEFPLGQLDDRVKNESVTAWNLVSRSSDDTLSLIDSKQPYMAISHVWADGTGAGTWGPGKVNKCLYRFFCDIAREFQCAGCWWDTISIPRKDELRNKALNDMHNNYANARVTLVHDLYLREWEWVDAETACFAIVMSPWYSRGWTALELAKSHKVKILFKARNDRFVVKDLDVDILDEVSQQHPIAQAIRTLRMAKIETFGDLSSILSPRDTSKPRDIPIISGLLAGVDVSGVLSQQEIYQRILRKLGKVAQGHLFHNSATMAAPGFSWCPTNILDMPRTEIKSDSVRLVLRENGDLEGWWKVYSTDSVEDLDFVWQGTHTLTRASLKSALGKGKRRQHLLLAENVPGECTRALLVQPMHREGQRTDVIYCRFVGPVYFYRALGSGEHGSSNQDLKGRVLKVGITNNDKMQKLDRDAWRFVCDMFGEQEMTKESEATITDPAGTTSTSDDDDFGRQEMRALLFLTTNSQEIHEQLFLEGSKIQPTSQSKLSKEMVMYCTYQDENKSSASIKAFFYGHEHFLLGKIKDWLANSITATEKPAKAGEAVNTRKLMHLSSDKDRKIQVDSTELSAKDTLLDAKALRLAVDNQRQDLAAPLVSFLFQNGARHVPNHKVIVGEDQHDEQSIIHLAAKKGFLAIAKEIVKYMNEDDLNGKDRDGCTALVVATQNGHSDIMQLLLEQGAATDVCNEKHNIALHYAALHTDVSCVVALLSHAEAQCQKEEAMSLASSRAGEEEPNGDTENASSIDAGEDGDGGSCEPLSKSSTNQMHPEFSQKANLELTNDEKRTALQLASQKGNSEVVKLLMKHGAKTSVSDLPEQTALALAAQHGRVETVKILLGDHPDQDHPDQDHPDQDQPNQDQPDQDQPDQDQPDQDQPDQDQPDQDQPDQDHSHKSQTDKSQLLSAIKESSFCEEKASLEQVIESQTKKSQPEKSQPEKSQSKKSHSKESHSNMWEQCELDAALLSAIKELSSSEDKADKASLEEVIKSLLEHGAKPGPSDPDGMTALHWAIKVKNETIAKELIKIMGTKDGILEKKSNKEQQSALVMAVNYRQFGVAFMLLNTDVDIYSTDSRKRTALHWAVVTENLKIATKLTAKAAEATKAAQSTDTMLEAKDVQGHTALHLAAQSGEAKLTRQLIKEGAIISRRDHSGRNALILAAQSKRVEVVRALLEKDWEVMQDDDYSGKTALDWAAMKGFDDVVRVMIDHSKSTLKEKAAEKALRLAAQAGHLKVSIMLLENIKEPKIRDSLVSTILFSPAAAASTSDTATDQLMRLIRDPDLQDENGQTALMFAIRNGKEYLLYRLLDLNADPNLSDHKKRTPLMLAAQRDDRDMISLLLYNNANPDMQDDRSYTAMHYAAESGRLSIMRHLARWQLKINANLQDLRGRTALHIAMENIWSDSRMRSYFFSYRRARDFSDEVLSPLLKAGARVNIQDAEQQTLLHWAVRQDQTRIVRLLLEYKHDTASLDIPDAEGRTPLLLAAEMGNYSIVCELLQTKHPFNPDKQDKKGRTSLLLAAEGGHESSVEVLLQNEANLNLPDNKARTALMRAAQNGHHDIVSLLTDKGEEQSKRHRREDAYLDARDDTGRTALMLAAESGHSQIVELLKGKGADLSLIDYEKKKAWQRAMDKGHADIVGSLLSTRDVPNQDTVEVNEALLVASRRGWTELVKVLLEHQADVTFQREGETALHMAALGGHVQVAKELLQKDIGIVAQDKRNRTPLMLATEHGFESLVELLLAKSEVKDNINEWMGPEALRCAAEKDNRGIVYKLLKSKTDPNGCDLAGRTALTLAAGNGNKEIVDFLLESKADPNIKDNQHRTALHHAAWGGHDGVVESLLKWKVEINALDNGEQGALHLAAERASKSVVQLLLTEGANPNAKSKDGQNPLHRAAWGGSHETVKLLRQRGADSSLKDNSDNKPWQVAAEKGFEFIVQTLLEDEENIRDERISKWKALIFASQRGYATMAKALLDKGAESMVPDENRLIPLHWAAKRGDDVMVKLLIEKGGPNMKLDAVDDHSQTPLCLAVQHGQATVVRTLLGKGADPNIVGQKGRTVLHIAAKENNSEIVQILGKHKVDPHVRDNQKQKAWLLAARYGHHHIVRLLLEREVDFNPRSQKIEELFLEMAAKGFVPMVDLLLRQHVDKNAADRLGRSAIAIAAERQEGNVVKLLLSAGADPGTPDSNLQTPLLWAAKTGNQRIMKMLLDNITGKDSLPKGGSRTSSPSKLLNHTDARGRTALLVALENQHDDVAKLLLDEGLKGDIDLNLGDTTKRTALHFAAEAGNDELLRLLLRQGAERTLKDTLDRTPLFLAADYDKETAVEILLRPRKNAPDSAPYNATDNALEIPDMYGRTVLHVAVERGNSKIIRMLLGCNANQGHSDHLGRTALSIAVENGYKKVVELLLEKNAKQDLPNCDKRTALSLAVANGDRSILEVLLDLSVADIEAIDETAWTLLQLAVKSGNKEVTWLVAEQITQGQHGNPLGPRPSQDTSVSSDGVGQ